jgi:hypothetical protein
VELTRVISNGYSTSFTETDTNESLVCEIRLARYGISQLHHELQMAKKREGPPAIAPPFTIWNFNNLGFIERCGAGFGCVASLHYQMSPECNRLSRQSLLKVSRLL